MIAALPMYDWPEVRAANDAFWSLVAHALRGQGIPAPTGLTRDRDVGEIWRDPGLVIGQTCGLPFVSGRCGGAIVFARPDYAVEGARGGTYRSALVCRREDAGPLSRFRGCRAAINDYGSQSGCNALADAVGETDFFRASRVSGSHRASAGMVAAGEADIAAIDAVAWALFRRHDPAAEMLAVIGWTRPMPALPFITSGTNSGRVPDLLAALQLACAAVSEPGVPVRVLSGGAQDYDPIRAMADSLRGRRLAPGTPPVSA